MVEKINNTKMNIKTSLDMKKVNKSKQEALMKLVIKKMRATMMSVIKNRIEDPDIMMMNTPQALEKTTMMVLSPPTEKMTMSTRHGYQLAY